MSERTHPPVLPKPRRPSGPIHPPAKTPQPPARHLRTHGGRRHS